MTDGSSRGPAGGGGAAQRRVRRGLVVGKFLPLHPGHALVIERALTGADEVDVVICDRPGERPGAETRARWVEALYPKAHVHVVADQCSWHGDDDCVPECSPVWAEYLARLLDQSWDRVYGSDPYVVPFAVALGAEDVLVDVARATEPYYGRVIRNRLGDHWEHLAPVVRAGLVRRVVVLGAESTGTTTLTADLAAALGTPWVPEFGRQYSQLKAEAARAGGGSFRDVTWHSSDFDNVADGQEAAELTCIEDWTRDAAASQPAQPWQPILPCDTDVLATALWHRRYVVDDNPELLARGLAHPPLLYVLTSDSGVEFEQDGLRDGEAIRPAMTSWFRDVLRQEATPWIEVVGNRQERTAAVLTWLNTNAGPACATSIEALAHPVEHARAGPS